MNKSLEDYDWDGDLYCSVFAEGKGTIEDLLATIEGFLAKSEYGASRTLGDTYFQGALHSDFFALTVYLNQSRNKRKMKDPANGFLRFTFYVTISPVRDISRPVYSKVLSGLLNYLHERGYAVVAACKSSEFEEELPSYPLGT